MKRFAFTMLELVFVIIVIGILAVLAMPNFRGNPLQTAAEQVASHIRYTQHLAMVDDKFDPTDATWWKERWQIRFLTNGATNYYDIFSDVNQGGNSDEIEEAIDPLTHERLGSGNTLNTPNNSVNLTDNYGITAIAGTCIIGGTNKIGFDQLGRPYLGVSAGIFSNSVPVGGCTIILQHQTDGNATITIHPETGYVSVAY
ncbi:MAG: type II secretion system protein [Sulfuricurvum sp.]|jgi:Tfp pilus assembly protein FimT